MNLIFEHEFLPKAYLFNTAVTIVVCRRTHGLKLNFLADLECRTVVSLSQASLQACLKIGSTNSCDKDGILSPHSTLVKS